MKRVLLLLVLTFTSATAFAQFRGGMGFGSEEKINTPRETLTGGGESFFSRLFDPERFSMHQTYSMSFMSGGGASVGLGMFTNTFSYKASDNVFVSADVSAVYSPFSSLGAEHAKSLNGIYLSNARLDWKLGDHTFLQVSYSALPNSFMHNSYSPWYW